MAQSILKLKKVYKTTFLVESLNKKYYFINLSSFKIMGAIKGVNIKL